MRKPFLDCHPIVNFIFYVGAFVMGMCLLHPLFLSISLTMALACFLLIEQKKAAFLLYMLTFGTLIAVINPLFNTQGTHILFTYFQGRPYTLEALCYGIALGAMFVTILIWFATYQKVMTSDKFLFCFGRMAPAASLILTMVFRLVPNFQRKVKQITDARCCIGKSAECGTRKEKATQGTAVVSVLTSWALEGGIMMSDSMQSRGFGSGRRTHFSIYRLETRDKQLLIFMIAACAMVCLSVWKGGTAVTYTPEIFFSEIKSLWTLLGAVFYFLFLSIPTTMYILEELTWRILKSKI